MFIIMFIFEVVAAQRQLARRERQSTNTTAFAANLTIAIHNDIAATNNLS
jgi:hypothetical protein